MLAFIIANLSSIILSFVLLGCVTLAVKSVLRSGKKGCYNCDCSACGLRSGCSGAAHNQK